MLDGMVQKIATTVAGGTIVALVGWVYALNTNQSDTKAEVYAAFGTLAEIEQRSMANEVRSRVNEEMKRMLEKMITDARKCSCDHSSAQQQALKAVETIEEFAVDDDEPPAPVMAEPVAQQIQQVEQRPLDIYIKEKKTRFRK